MKGCSMYIVIEMEQVLLIKEYVYDLYCDSIG